MIVADVGFVGAICIIAFIIWIFKASIHTINKDSEKRGEEPPFAFLKPLGVIILVILITLILIPIVKIVFNC